MNYNNDELYLIVDFLEEQLDIQRDKSAWGLTLDEQEELETEEFFFIRTQEIIKSLIKE